MSVNMNPSQQKGSYKNVCCVVCPAGTAFLHSEVYLILSPLFTLGLTTIILTESAVDVLLFHSYRSQPCCYSLHPVHPVSASHFHTTAAAAWPISSCAVISDCHVSTCGWDTEQEQPTWGMLIFIQILDRETSFGFDFIEHVAWT